MLKAILKIAAPKPKLESFDRYLFVGPHPDDIEIGAGASVSRLVSLGKQVSFLICLDGRFGFDNAPEGLTPEELIEIRKREALESAKLLGVDDVHFLGLCDGGFYENMDLRRGIAYRVGIFQPDVIFTVDPDVKSECHIDHINVGRETKVVANFASNGYIMKALGAQKANIKALGLYMTAKPNCYIRTKGHLKKQLEAIFSVHRSQFPDGCEAARSIGMYLKLRHFFHLGREGFRTLAPVHMHCMPESEN